MDQRRTRESQPGAEAVSNVASAQTLSRIEGYEPRLGANCWDPIAETVRDVVRRAGNDNARRTLSLMSTVTAFVHWCHRRGDRLSGDLFVVERIEEFIAEAAAMGWSPSTRSTRRSELIAVGDALNGPSASGRLCSVDSRAKSAPYGAAEVTALREWSHRQRSARRCVDAGVLVGLGLGAGLSGGEIVEVRASDIIDTGTAGFSVVVNGRVVPVLSRFSMFIRSALEVREPEQRLFGGRTAPGGKNLVSTFIGKCSPVNPVLSTHRMRTTWLVGRLNAGVPIKDLMAAAGLESLRSINECLAWVEPSGAVERDRLLRLDRRVAKAS